jgi:hypothetical protein
MALRAVMTTSSRQRSSRVEELLLAQLRAAGGLPWPGSDALTVADVLCAYPPAAANGRVPGRLALQHRHPELAAALAVVFAAWDAPVVVPLAATPPGRTPPRDSAPPARTA